MKSEWPLYHEGSIGLGVHGVGAGFLFINLCDEMEISLADTLTQTAFQKSAKSMQRWVTPWLDWGKSGISFWNPPCIFRMGQRCPLGPLLMQARTLLRCELARGTWLGAKLPDVTRGGFFRCALDAPLHGLPTSHLPGKTIPENGKGEICCCVSGGYTSELRFGSEKPVCW